jgi:putative zinc-dependent peptidase DUF5700
MNSSSIIPRRLLNVLIISIGFTSICLAQGAMPSAVDVRIITDEADAVLSILAKKRANQPIAEADWQRVFQSEGYIRLKKREASLQYSFEDADFKSFVLSDSLAARAKALEETLDKWKRADITGAAGKALAYLPKQAQIRAKIYPVIKPKENSFVFEVKTDPAIFLYLDPAQSKEQFENVLAHELHHIGHGSGCLSKQASDEISKLPPLTRAVIRLLGGFGEGYAMLAAAGGPDTHPHSVSRPEDRARWDKDVSNFNDDLKKVEKFFLDLLENRLTQEEAQKTVMSFLGVQGPWYTVGWKMSVMIEKTYGRQKLIESFCDHRQLLPLYNKAAEQHNRHAREPLVLWSESLIKTTQQ